MIIGIIGTLFACAIFFFGFYHGFKAGIEHCKEAQRNQELGAVCERWKGHVSHKGHRIVSPIRQEESEESHG